MDWFTADYHLGESRMEILGRPFKNADEMLAVLFKNHNELVSPDDTVHFVGDVVYQKVEDPLCWLDQIAHFNGKKILYRGNHDRIFDDETLSKYFVEIYGETAGGLYRIDQDGFNITHYPTNGVGHRFNLVGHIHAAWKVQLNMLNVGVDVHHFRPINTEQVLFMKNAITNFYDEDVWVAYRTFNSSYRSRGVNGRYLNSLITLPTKEELKEFYQKTYDEIDLNSPDIKFSGFSSFDEKYVRSNQAKEAVYKKLFIDAMNIGYFKNSKIHAFINNDYVNLSLTLPPEISNLCDYISDFLDKLKSSTFYILNTKCSLGYNGSYFWSMRANHQDAKIIIENFGETIIDPYLPINELKKVLNDLEMRNALNHRPPQIAQNPPIPY